MSDSPLDDELRELMPRLRRFALWLVRDPSSADDLVHATLERALSRWSTRCEEASLRGWLFATLYRQSLDGRRRALRHAKLAGRFRMEEELPWPPAEREAVGQPMLHAFGRLNVDQRSLLLWITVEGLSYKEVAEILAMPIGTVMSRLSHARQALRRLCEGEPPAPFLRALP